MNVHINAALVRGSFHLQIDVNLVDPVTGVYGPSGAGKTTLLHLIAGLIRPQSGHISIDDDILDDVDKGIHLPAHRRRIGLVFQHGHLFQHLSVADNLHYGERLISPDARRISFAPLVDLLELGPLLTRRPSDLSGGERQRVALGRSLLASPRLLLCDEPLASLDATLKRQILGYLRRIRDNLRIPFIYVSHDITEITQLTQHLLLLRAGSLQAHGAISDLMSKADQIEPLGGWALPNVIATTVVSHDTSGGVTTSMVGTNVAIRSRLREEPPGTTCILAIRPTDVVLSSEQAVGASVDNQIPGRVQRVVHADNRVVAIIDIGVPLRVDLSSRSADAVRLEEGMHVWCQFSSLCISPD